ncbi:flavin reductase family protein [Rhizobium puerariae]|uniref:Flavin reductase family protein n=1 Tax=Rhizobium puerariae TaxID=1585791 RepID=A0ABV6ADI1_9HYPH
MIAASSREEPAFASVDAVRFRAIMRNPVSSVAIVATGECGNRAGCTVTAVCSLSDSPPSLLVCLNRQSTARQAVIDNRRFTVNYLDESQQGDADLLAGRLGMQGEGKFSPERWETGPNGLPCLRGALAVLVCELADVTEFGSHSIFYGEIREAMVHDQARPLLYGQGRYLTASIG